MDYSVSQKLEKQMKFNQLARIIKIRSNILHQEDVEIHWGNILNDLPQKSDKCVVTVIQNTHPHYKAMVMTMMPDIAACCFSSMKQKLTKH
jgi:hypothetical protein